jgi:hypothetical protein
MPSLPAYTSLAIRQSCSIVRDEVDDVAQRCAVFSCEVLMAKRRDETPDDPPQSSYLTIPALANQLTTCVELSIYLVAMDAARPRWEWLTKMEQLMDLHVTIWCPKALLPQMDRHSYFLRGLLADLYSHVQKDAFIRLGLAGDDVDDGAEKTWYGILYKELVHTGDQMLPLQGSLVPKELGRDSGEAETKMNSNT